MNKFVSINGRFIVEPYLSDRAIKMESNTGGFQVISQKVNLVGLRMLVDTKFTRPMQSVAMDGFSQTTDIIPAGTKVYIREEYLHTAQWAKTLLQCPAIEGKFMIVEPQFIEFVEYQ